MTIDPTRGEWKAAEMRITHAVNTNAPMHNIVRAVLGPCPPEPAPPPFCVGGYTLVRSADPYPGGRGKIAVPRHVLTPDEAFAMAEALIAHASYAREQGDDGPICGGLRRRDISEPLCLRPKGHAGACGAVSA